jgi:hypothetical protein
MLGTTLSGLLPEIVITGAVLSNRIFAPEVTADAVVVAVPSVLPTFARKEMVPSVSEELIVVDAAQMLPLVLIAVVVALPAMETVGEMSALMSEVKVTTSPTLARVVDALLEAMVTGVITGFAALVVNVCIEPNPVPAELVAYART